MKIGYIGAGKLGMPVAACVAQKHDVLMHDAEPSVYLRWGRYPFVESVKATYPFYVLRLLGGLLYLSGMIIMLWNTLKTATAGRASSVTIPAAAAHA